MCAIDGLTKISQGRNLAEKKMFQTLLRPVLYIMTGDLGLKCYDSVDVKRFVLGNKNP